MKRLLYTLIVVLLHLSLTLICFYFLINYEDGVEINTNEFFLRILYFSLRFILSFPLGILAWFSEDFMGNLLFLSIPNGIIIANIKPIIIFIKIKFGINRK